MNNSVEVKKLSFNYGSGKGSVNLKSDLDLEIKDGEFMVLLRPFRLWKNNIT